MQGVGTKVSGGTPASGWGQIRLPPSPRLRGNYLTVQVPLAAKAVIVPAVSCTRMYVFFTPANLVLKVTGIVRVTLVPDVVTVAPEARREHWEF